MTDAVDDDPAMPDALEVAAALDAALRARPASSSGPLHGVVIAIKDQYDTFDMRTTSGADAFYANDRPPDDATFVQRLRDAGRDHPRQGQPGRVRVGRRAQLVRRHVLQPVRHRALARRVERRLGLGVAANLVTCAIAEETGSSIRGPARREQRGRHRADAGAREPRRHDPARHQHARRARSAARSRTPRESSSVIAGYDPKDELTAFSVGRLPTQPYETLRARSAARRPAHRRRARVHGPDARRRRRARASTIVEQANRQARARSAPRSSTPAPAARCSATACAAMRRCWHEHGFPELFPVDARRQAAQIDRVRSTSRSRPRRVPEDLTIRSFANARFDGERKYMMNRYLASAATRTIKTNADLIAKANFYSDDRFPDRKAAREQAEDETNARHAQRRLKRPFRRAADRAAVHAAPGSRCADVSDERDTACEARRAGQRRRARPQRGPYEAASPAAVAAAVWSFLGQQGFPTITVPAGFTSEVYDREIDPSAPKDADGDPGTKLVGPTPARLPVGIDFLARPFGEPVLLTIASAYESRDASSRAAARLRGAPVPELSSRAVDP